MVITVSKAELFDEVEKRSSLEGVQLPERFEQVWASAEEGAFLDSYWREGYTAVIQLMKRYLENNTVVHTLNEYEEDEVLTIRATMPARYNSLLDGNVATDVKMMIACNILTGWLSVQAPEAAKKYEEEAKGYTEDLRVKLLWRLEPTAKMVAPTADTSAFDKGVALGSADSDGVAFDKGVALGSADAEKVNLQTQGMPLFVDGMDSVQLLDEEDSSTFGGDVRERDRNIYPSHEFIGEKCHCDDVKLEQGRRCSFELRIKN